MTKFRINVLSLLLIAYVVLLLLFCVLVKNEVPAKEAYGLIENALLVLLGGSVAVVKDLVD